MGEKSVGKKSMGEMFFNLHAYEVEAALDSWQA